MKTNRPFYSRTSRSMKGHTVAAKCCAILSIIVKKRCPDYNPQMVMFESDGGFYRPASTQYLNTIARHINGKKNT